MFGGWHVAFLTKTVKAIKRTMTIIVGLGIEKMLINKVSKSYNHSSGPMKSIAKNRISFVLLFHELILKFNGDQRREEKK